MATKTKHWTEKKGNGPKDHDWSGMTPIVCVPFTDKTCREIDEDVLRMNIRRVLEWDIGHFGMTTVTEGCTLKERLRVLKIAQEETKGRVPIAARAHGVWTHEVVEDAKRMVDAGADCLNLNSDVSFADDNKLLQYCRLFDKAVRTPWWRLAGSYSVPNLPVPLPTYKRLALECENLVGFKIEVKSCDDMDNIIAVLREAEKETGRHLCALVAGDFSLAEMLIVGAEGNVNGGGAWRGEIDVAIGKAVKAGNYNEAIALQKKVLPATHSVRGYFHTKQGRIIRPISLFRIRYKMACWLRGYVPNPYYRAPEVQMPKDEVLWMREAFIESGLNVVRTEKDCVQFEACETTSF